MPARDYYLPQRRLVSQEDAAMSERANVPRSRFVGSWSRKTTFDAGYLVPFLVDEILPGDHMRYEVTAYVRMSTPLFPLFDSQRVDTFFFFVPCRIIWENWVRFMGETDDPLDSIDFTIPQMPGEIGGYEVGSIYDHMGLPVAGMQVTVDAVAHSALPLRAYNLIWNQWFRDQNLQDSAVVNKDDGPDSEADYALLRRAKSHDYFTSALPWPQKFTAPVVIGNVSGIGTPTSTASANLANVRESGGSVVTYPFYHDVDVETTVMRMTAATAAFPDVFAEVGINDLRQAFLVQQLLERDARGGTRYAELILSHFGVRVPDFRVQRPEYIGGGQSPLNITPIAQTAPDAESVVGALGGTGTAAGQHRASYASTEHGYVIGLINVRSELSYQQGLHKMWSRLTRYDFYLPSLAQLGEQAVLKKEIYAIGAAINDDLVFGYQERWQEYRTRYSEVTGEFRSNQPGTIDPWHLAQYFGSAPVLGPTFIVDNPPMDRVLAAGSSAVGQQYLADIHIRRTAVRPIPMFGTPAQLGRF